MKLEDEFLPFHTTTIPEGPYLILAPHPDDETFAMGGTIAISSRLNINVHVVFLTQGDKGGTGNDLVSIRREEARAAAETLGIKELVFWKEPDRGLKASDGLVQKAVNLIKRIRPGTIFFPSPLEIHPDHRETAKIISLALHKMDFNGNLWSYETLREVEINRLVDITSVIEVKKKAINQYKSQLMENNYKEVSRSINKARTITLLPEIEYAEGFYSYDLKKHKNIFQELADRVTDFLLI